MVFYEGEQFVVNETDGLHQIGLNEFAAPTTSIMEASMPRLDRDSSTGALAVTLQASGTASAADYSLTSVYLLPADGKYYGATHGAGSSFTITFPDTVPTVYFALNSTVDDIPEETEFAVFTILDGANYDPHSIKFSNGFRIHGNASYKQNDAECGCPSSGPTAQILESPATRTASVEQQIGDGVSLIYRDRYQEFAGKINWGYKSQPTDNDPARAEVRLKVNGTEVVRRNHKFDAPPAENSTTSFGFSLIGGGVPGSVNTYEISFDVLVDSAEASLSRKATAGSLGTFYEVNWDANWFGAGWGLKGLSSLYVDDMHAVVRDADGVQQQIREQGTASTRYWVSDPGRYGRSTLTTSGTSATLADDQGNVLTFSKNDTSTSTGHYRLLESVEANGSKTSYTYENSVGSAFDGKRPTTVTLPSGRVAYLHYVTGQDVVDAITYDAPLGSGGATLRTDLTRSGSALQSIAPPDPVTSGIRPLTSFEYESGQVKKVTERLATSPSVVNRETIYTYNVTTRALTQVQNPDGSMRGYAYDTAANGLLAKYRGQSSVRVTDELGREERMVFDANGNMVAKVDAEGNLTEWEYDYQGHLLKQIDADPDGNGPLSAPVTEYEYDANDNLILQRNPDGNVRTWAYDPTFNRVADEYDELGRRTHYDIDTTTANIRYQQEVVGSPDGPLTYNTTTGQVTAGVVDDRVTSYLYSPIPSGTDPLPGGLVLKEWDALGRATTYEYWRKGTSGNGGNDANHGKLKQVTLPNVAGEVTGSVYRTYTYDTNGYRDVVTDELGRPTDYHYDALGRLIKTTYADPYADDVAAAPFDETTYDGVGRQTATRDKNGSWTYFSYSYPSTGVYRVTSTAPARESTSTQVVSYVEYDGLGNQVKSVDGLGRVTTQVYDSLNRLRQTIQPDPDGAGPLTSPVTTFAYDRMGRQVATTEAADLRNMNPATGFWPSMAPTTEAGLSTDIIATTAVPRTELDLDGVFKDDQDADSALTYSIQSVGGSASYFDAVSITPTSPPKLLIEYSGTTNFMDAPITVRATDTSGLTKDVTFYVDRTQATNAEFKVNTTTLGTQKATAVAAKPDGGFVVAWEDAQTGVIRAQQFDKNGSTWSSEFTVSSGFRVLPNVAVAPNGKIVFTYWRNESGQNKELYRRTFNADGTSAESEVLVGSYLASQPASPNRPGISFLADGGYVIAWRDSVSGDHNIKAQRFTSSGATQGSTFTVNSTTSGSQFFASAAGTKDGGFVIVWHGNGSGDTQGVFSRRYLSDGTAVGNEVLINPTTTGTQYAAVTPQGAFVVVWEGQGTDAQTGTTDTAGIWARLRAADGTPLSGEILVNQSTANTQDLPSVAAAPDGGFVVAWHGDDGTNGYQIYTRRFLANGVATGNEQLMNSTNSGAQTNAAVAVTPLGAVVATWSGNGTGDTEGIMARFASPFDPSNTLVGPFRVLSVTPSETVAGPVEKLLVTLSGPVDAATVATGDFTVTGPAGSVTLNTPAVVSATQILLTFATPQSAIGTYTVTVKPTISRTSGAGGGQIDQNLDGSSGNDPADRAEFAFFIGGGETAPTVATAIPDLATPSGDTTLPRSTVDLSTYFQDGQQVSSQLQYSVVSVSFNTNTIFRDVSVAESDGKTLLIDYEAGVGLTGWADITVRAMDVTGRSTVDTFRVTRTDALASAPAASYFRVLSIDPYQQSTGPFDRFSVAFSDAVDWTTFTSTDITLPGGVTVSGIARAGTRQAVVTLNAYVTALSPFAITIGPDIQNTAAKKIDQNDDGTTGAVPADNFTTTIYLALGPTNRTEYDVNSQTIKSIDAAGIVTSYVYDAAGQRLASIDALNRATVSRYDVLGQLISTAQPYPQGGFDQTKDDGDGVAVPSSGVWNTVTGSGQNGDHIAAQSTVGGSDKYTYNFTVTAGKSYEVVISWPALTTAATNTPFTIWDDATSIETHRVNQQVAPAGHPLFGSSWQTVGYYTPTSTTLRVRLTRDADAGKNVLADGVRVLEVSADRFKYDAVGNLEYTTDARGSQTKHIYDARNRQTALYQPAPDGANAGKAVDGSGNPLGPVTKFGYNAAGERVYTVDPVNRKTEVLYDGLGRQQELIAPIADPNATPFDATVDLTSAPSGFTNVNDVVAYGDSYYKKTSNGTANWTVTGLTANKYYQVLVTWRSVSGNTTDAKYRVYDGGALNREFHVNQRLEPSDWYEPDTTVPTNQDAWWKRLMVFKAAGTSINVELTRVATDGDLVADAVRLIEVGPTTSYLYDDQGNLKSVQQPDLGGTYGRPLTEYTYDKHHNLTKITFPDPDGTGTQYTVRPEINYQYDDADRRVSEKNPRGVITWSVYDNLDRTTAVLQPVADTGVTPLDVIVDDATSPPTGWTRVTDSNAYGNDYSYTTSSNPLTRTMSGLTPGKSYLVLATWLAEATAAVTNAKYEILDGSSVDLASDVFQGAAPSGYYDGTRNWRPLGVITADNTSVDYRVTNIVPGGTTRAVADAVRLIEIGPVTQFAYDSRGNLLRTTDPLGRITQSVFDAFNRETSQIDPLGFRTFAGFDLAGQQTVQVDKLGRATTLAYDKLSRVMTVTQPDPDAAGPLLAPVVDFGYDAVGNRVKLTEPDPTGSAGRSVTDYSFDRLNRLTKVERNDPDAGGADARPTTTFTYTAAGELDTTTQTLGTGAGGSPPSRAWKQEYDQLGRLTKTTAPKYDDGTATGPVTEYGYDAHSRKTSETRPDPDGGGNLLAPVTNWTYDNLGRLAKQELPDPDNIQGTTNPLGRPTTEYKYDVAGNLIESKSPDPADTDGSAEAVILTTYAYDYLNRRTSETRNDPDSGGPLANQVTAYSYDAVGNRVRVTEPDPDGSSNPLQPPVTWHTFDALNREVATLDAREGVTRYTFDAAGNRTSLTDPVLNTTAWTYDRLNRAIADMNTLGDARRMEYDAAGRQTREVDRNGRVVKYAYDPLNRRTKEEWFTNEADGTADRTITWDYDVADQLEAITDRDASNAAIGADYSYTYDRRGNVELVTSDLAGLLAAQTTYLRQTYDDLGRRKDSKASTGASENTLRDYLNVYTYDTLSRLTSISQDKQGSGAGYDDLIDEKRADFVYNALGQTQQIRRFHETDGLSANEASQSDYTYDQFGHLTNLVHKKPDDSVITSYGYVYDHLNRMTSVDFPSAYNAEDVSIYAYDATDQLVTADRTSGSDESYVNDLNGNRRMSGTSNWVVGTNNQVVRDGTFEYHYDDEGNRTERVTLVSGAATGATTLYEYDHRNRLTKVTDKTAYTSGTTTRVVEYAYDAFDHLVKRAADTTSPFDMADAAIEQLVYDGQNVALKFNGSGSLTTNRYLHGQAADQALAEEQTGSWASANRTYWTLGDHLGTIRDIANQIGVLKDHIAYDAFGNVTSETSTTINVPYGFTGFWYDRDTKLNFSETRVYDAATGTWMQKDFIDFDGGDANLMRYVGNSVTNFVDANGMNPNKFGAKDGDELIQIVEQLEEEYRQENGVYPHWRKAAQLLLDDQMRKVDFNSNHYYVFGQRHKRWIDMRHFITAVVWTDDDWGLVGRTPEEVRIGGQAVEIGQAMVGSASAFGVEDDYSNWLGIVFAEKWTIREKTGHCFLLSSALREDFGLLMVGSKMAAKSYPFLPASEAEWDEWRHGPTFKDMVEMEGAMVLIRYPGPPHVTPMPPTPPPNQGFPWSGWMPWMWPL